MDVKLPDGTVLKGIPDGTTKEQIIQKLGPEKASQYGLIDAPTAPEPKGWLDQSLQQAKAGQQTAADLYTQGAQTLPETLLQGAATGADVINEASSQALSAITPDFIGEPLQRGAQSAISYLADTPVGDAARFIGDEYSEFAQDNPRAARNLSALARIGTVTAPFVRIGGKSVAGSALAPVEKGIAGAGGAAKKAGGRAVQAVTPSPKLIEDAPRIASLAEKYKVPIGIDDVSEGSFYKTLVSEGQNLPFSGHAPFVDAQNKAFTRAVSRSIGLDSDKLTPEILDDAFTNIGKEFDSFFTGKNIDLGKDFGIGLRQSDFLEEVGDMYDSAGKGILSKYMGKINSLVDETGTIQGKDLKNIRNQLAKIARTSGNPEISSAARDLENFIIDSVANSSSIPDAARKSFTNAKYKYKNLITIEPLAQKSQVSGQIPPAQLLQRVRSVYKRDFTRGKAGELGDLANIGQYIKSTVPNSGTSQRTLAKNILTGNAIGAVPTLYFGGLPAAAAQGGLSALGLMANRALQSSNMNPSKLAKLVEKGSGSPLFLENQALRQLGK